MLFDYEKAWREVEKLEQEGLPKSALKQVLVILEQAKKEAATGQHIKALIMRGKYESQLEESGIEQSIAVLQREIDEASVPVAAVLHSLIGELYAKYHERHSWKISERTQTVDFENEDIKTWSTEQFVQKSAYHFKASIASRAILKIAANEIEPVLVKGNGTEGLRPTLYDFLMHRAIDHFTNERLYLNEPSYKFEINDSLAFSSVPIFTNWKIATPDTSSNKLQVLFLFQELLKYKAAEKRLQSPALLDADLKRLRFVHKNSISPSKNQHFVHALKRLQKEYRGHEGTAEINFELAQFYQSQGYLYNPPPFGEEDVNDQKWMFKKAYDLCLQTTKDHPKAFYTAHCHRLISRLNTTEIYLESEMVNVPEKPFLTRLSYKNLAEIHLKVIPLSPADQQSFKKLKKERNWKMKAIEFINSKSPLKSWSVKLPDDGDLHTHTSELKIDGLPLGTYAIIASQKEDFSGEGNNIGYLLTNVSNIGYWERRDHNNGVSFVVFDRNSGQPLNGARVDFWVQTYNSISRKYDEKIKDTQITDEDGFVKPNTNKERNRNFRLKIKYAEDQLDTDISHYNSFNNRENKESRKTEIFLDRAIYRPGQTIYFKGIAIRTDKDRMPHLIKNEPVSLQLLDVNRQEAARLQLVTNEYGSFNGQFTAPRTGLTGSMTIKSDIGRNAKVFRVEEYKRPKFEVNFDPIQSSFQLNNEVSISGTATAFAGNAIDNASVKFRVVRETRFPWYWRRGGWMPWRNESMEIAHGIAQTDANGQFQLSFEAIPDLKILPESKPVFEYHVYADVTDLTGETSSTSTMVKVGYVGIEIDVPMAEQIQQDSLKKLTFSIKNLNGEPVATTGSLSLKQLAIPQQIYVERMWGSIDRQIIPEKSFKTDFPNYAWSNEQEPNNWPVLKTLLEQSFNTEKSTQIDLSDLAIQAGWYEYTIHAKDGDGQAVTYKKYFQVMPQVGEPLAVPTLLWHKAEKSTLEPGEIFKVNFASTLNQPVLIEFEKEGKVLKRKWLNTSTLNTESLSIAEEHRGNIYYTYSFAGLNRSNHVKNTINVPWSNKELSFEYGTFRDKLKPGQEEEWILKIKGPKGEQIAAEMLAGMYDASLDVFASNDWSMNLFPMSWGQVQYNSHTFTTVSQNTLYQFNENYKFNSNRRSYDALNLFGWSMYNNMVMRRSMRTQDAAMSLSKSAIPAPPAPQSFDANVEVYADEAVVSDVDLESGIGNTNDKEKSVSPQPQIRTNLNETVFFFPNLMTDEEGNILIKFKMNEALTKWKFLGLAHTKDLSYATSTKEVVTQKELMVVPNPPRFFREFDEIEFSAKVVNLTDKSLSGNAELQLVNPLTAIPVFKWLDNPQFNEHFEVAANSSSRVSWRFKVPDVADVPVIEHTVLAVAGTYSDGERSVTPNLSNRMLVTESKPLPVRGGESKSFQFESFKTNTSTTLRHQGLTLEFTQNPAWYAVQSLPYLMEYPYDCSEQIFSRYYANSLASSVANAHPKVKAVFDSWANSDADALKSNLSKNEELKTALLEETPWVLDAQSEAVQKQNIALLFDLNKMSYEQDLALKKLQDRQMPGGGWSWFPEGRGSWHITQYIIEGFGHLYKLNVSELKDQATSWQMIQKAVQFCDRKLVDYYEDLEQRVKEEKTTWEEDHLSHLISHYLYARSFYLNSPEAQASQGNVKTENPIFIPLDAKAKQAHTYFMAQANSHWLKKGLYLQGMLSLALFRDGQIGSAKKIIQSLKERSLKHDELGMYWKYPSGWWWYQAPIETHSLLIEAFSEIIDDPQAVDDMKVWLLKNKQTNHWKTTKATANAVYALLANGDNWLLDNTPLTIQLGDGQNPVSNAWNRQIKEAQIKAEKGTGYFKTRFDAVDVDPSMGKITVENPNNVIAWGAMYWQYFEQLDKIKTFEETPLTIKKQLFKAVMTDKGEVIQPIKEGASLAIGDKLMVRIELRVDRTMEYVHMKDMRASGFEPMNVLSQYKWKGGLGYYESTKDASTNFFFSYLPKGTHVFEYPLRVQHEGNFSNGITTVQCMYAPEFTSHSEGVRVQVEE